MTEMEQIKADLEYLRQHCDQLQVTIDKLMPALFSHFQDDERLQTQIMMDLKALVDNLLNHKLDGTNKLVAEAAVTTENLSNK